MYVYRIERVSPISVGAGSGGSIGYGGKKKKAKVPAAADSFKYAYRTAVKADEYNSEGAVEVFNGILGL